VIVWAIFCDTGQPEFGLRGQRGGTESNKGTAAHSLSSQGKSLLPADWSLDGTNRPGQPLIFSTYKRRLFPGRLESLIAAASVRWPRNENERQDCSRHPFFSSRRDHAGALFPATIHSGDQAARTRSVELIQDHGRRGYAEFSYLNARRLCSRERAALVQTGYLENTAKILYVD
jgi:hypothetical protein